MCCGSTSEQYRWFVKQQCQCLHNKVHWNPPSILQRQSWTVDTQLFMTAQEVIGHGLVISDNSWNQSKFVHVGEFHYCTVVAFIRLKRAVFTESMCTQIQATESPEKSIGHLCQQLRTWCKLTCDCWVRWAFWAMRRSIKDDCCGSWINKKIFVCWLSVVCKNVGYRYTNVTTYTTSVCQSRT